MFDDVSESLIGGLFNILINYVCAMPKVIKVNPGKTTLHRFITFISFISKSLAPEMSSLDKLEPL